VSLAFTRAVAKYGGGVGEKSGYGKLKLCFSVYAEMYPGMYDKGTRIIDKIFLRRISPRTRS